MRALHDHCFTVEDPRNRDGAWFFAILGRERLEFGGFPDAQGARRARWELLQRWQRRARNLGGHVWVRVAHEWVVTLPIDVPCGGRPLRRTACTRHLPLHELECP